jgi:N-methylhydantoinase A/oxoprolinase/acetone carboxylase beta subunit
VNYRVSAVGTSPKLEWVERWNGAANALKGRRDVFFEKGRLPCSIYERRWLKPGSQIDGPVVVEQVGSTTLLCPDQSARVDAYGNLIITVAEGGVKD